MNSQALRKTKLPDSPGVYFFIGARRKVLYIGKATSLHDRVRSYFNKDLIRARGEAIWHMVNQARSIEFRKTDSVLEALILEANLIRKYKPLYNAIGKDDKSFNYVVITDEDFPRILLKRGKELEAGEIKNRISQRSKKTKFQNLKLKAVYGPFPHGGQLKEALRIVRKIFPFRDKCAPLSQGLKDISGKNTSRISKGRVRKCFDAQIGLCPGVCDGSISKRDYGKIIRNIKLFFEGRKAQLRRGLEQDMKKYARGQEFEKAAKVRKTLFALNHIEDIALIKREKGEIGKIKTRHLSSFSDGGLTETRKGVKRIEAYDIAHLGGRDTVGVMVVVEDGEVKKSDYRKFKVRFVGINDVVALKEILTRRLAHHEWPLPDMFVVDGGKAQQNAAIEVQRLHFGADVPLVPVVGVVKNVRHKPEHLIGEARLTARYEKEILLANNEAHRFALRFHRERRRRPKIE
jgi:excinuclease ABC subunit C